MKISVVIPTSKMKDGEKLLTRSLEALWKQTFQDFEIVVSDNSDDDEILKICQFYGDVKYARNPVKGMAHNTNHAMRRAKGALIKILYMDDYLSHPDALQDIWSNFKGEWLVTGCEHTTDGEYTYGYHKPIFTENIWKENTIGSPSVLTIKNEDIIYFDENMQWLLDADYYKRMYDLYGEPVILKDTNVIIGLHEGQATHTMGDNRKAQEWDYINSKYNG